MGTESLSGSRTVGKFSITVDPSAAEPWTIRPVDEPPGSGKPSLRLQTTGPLPSGNTVLLGPQNVTVTGPGTYNPSTHTMSANVVITHNAPTAGDFDELQMVVTSLTSSSPGIAFVTNNNSTTGVGAVMAFADIQSTTSTSSICGVGVRKTSATHALRILDPADKAFSFAIDVRALSGSGASISPDCDGDGYNAELG
jgi:hypothetical protein